MNKTVITGKGLLAANAVVLTIALFFSASCTGNNSDVIEIKEKMFISQVNDVYLNPDDYLGKTIKLEGLFMMEYPPYIGTEPYCFVLRYGPGCCGTDGNVGFEVTWKADRKISYPEVNSWVEAVGELKIYSEEFYDVLYLELSSLNVKNTRGAEFVSQ